MVYQRPTSVFSGVRQLPILEKGYPMHNMHPTLYSKTLEEKYVLYSILYLYLFYDISQSMAQSSVL